MRLKYYGTAAAECVPGIFCTCEACEKSRKAGGRNIRTRSQALINDDLLIDFGPDTAAHVMFYGLDLRPVRYCLITHAHSDHLYAADLEMRADGMAHFGHTPDGKPDSFDIYSSGRSGEKIAGTMSHFNLGERAAMTHHIIKAYKPFEVGRYTVTALKAAHDPYTDPMLYIISDGKSTMLYAHDTGRMPKETWEYLERVRLHFDYVSLDCTGCVVPYESTHMGLPADIETKNRLTDIGCGDDKTIWCLHHFSHNGLVTHDELVPIAAEEGFIVSYDTMEIEF